MKRNLLIAVLLGVLLLCAAGSAVSSQADSRVLPVLVEENSPAVDNGASALPAADTFAPFADVQPAPIPASAGSGNILYVDEVTHLSLKQEKLLRDYMNHWFTSLERLSPGDASTLYTADAIDQLQSDRAQLRVLTEIRKMQQTDLSLRMWSWTLTINTAEEEENGDIRVRASEDSIQNFAAYPDIDSASFGIIHTFLLAQDDGTPRIREHRQGGSLNRVVRGLGAWTPGAASSFEQPSTDLEAQADKLLAGARADVAARQTQGAGTTITVTAENPYDRDAAIAYAKQWASDRNGDWPRYDRMGGNCQNFVSQAILAGGIPMDTTAPAQWKWYSDTPNSAFQAAGRSPAWSGVEEFLSYVLDNSGYGMVAAADAPFYSGQPGDIIHMGVDGDWRHTVMITEVMRDTDGNAIDYLVASNTANLRDFPVSAFYYTEQMLIRVLGWNT